jgi:membrane-bound lytic murein transglycosylase B
VVALGLLLLMGVVASQAVGSNGQPAEGASAAATPAPATGAPAALVPVARDAGRLTGVDAAVLLAISRVECDYGRCRTGLPDTMVPADVRGRIDAAKLGTGGETAQLLGLDGGRRVGDWVNPIPVAGGQHAMGFMQFLPSTWRQEARLAPGHPRDPYRPYDSMVTAGSYLSRLQRGAVDGRRRTLRSAVAAYGGDAAYADQVLAIAAAG